MISSNSARGLDKSWVIRLVVINILVFLFQHIISAFYNFRIEEFFGLNPVRVTENLWLWQLFTYMFLHSPVNIFHILFNMYLLWVFGLAVEAEWGPRTFLYFYLFSGFGAGISIFLLNLFRAPWSLTIGASGAIFALLLAFGILYPDSEILLFFVLPLKAKYLVVLYGGLEFYLMFSSNGDNISHIGHLGGLLFGFIYFLMFKRNYIFKNRRPKKQGEILGDIKKKVEEIKDKTVKQVQRDSVKNAGALKEKFRQSKNPILDKSEIKFLDALLKSGSEEARQNICKKTDFSTKDSYCQKCEYFNICLHRDTTGIDPLEENDKNDASEPSGKK